MKLHLPIGTDNENARTPDLPGEELEEKPGRIIGPVEIVQDEYDGLFLARSPPEARHAVEETEASGTGLED
jgi:hypothetical protein